jgi:uncharacterized phage protein (TIGR02218 family)
VTKTIDTDLLATYQSETPTIVVCVTLTRRDAQVFRWVGHNKDVTVDGNLYVSAPGVQIAALVSTDGFAVDNTEIKVLEDEDITRADILAGVWDGADMEIAEIDWKAETPVKNILKVGKLGNFHAKKGFSTVEFRDMRQAIQAPHETIMQPTCRYTLGDAKCRKDVSAMPYHVFGLVDSSADQYSVTDAARTEEDDYFAEGVFTFFSGPNDGMSQKIKSFSAGVFVFWQQFIYPIGADGYWATAGCRGRFQEDCHAKFDNVINFGGEPNKRNPDTLSAPA